MVVVLRYGGAPGVLGNWSCASSYTRAAGCAARLVVEKRSNVMDEQGIESLRDFLLVREFQGPLEWDPVDVLVPLQQTAFEYLITYQTPFKCIGPILTTARFFSLFKIPSLRPRVIPATLSNLVPLIIWLSSLRATQIPFVST